MLCYGWLGFACCPPQPQMMPGMPAFWAPAGPQPRRLTWGRARARQRPKRTARKPARKSKRNKTPQIAAVCGWGRARARARRPKTNEKKARTAQRASQPQQEQNGQNNSPTLSAAVFGCIYSVLESEGPACPAALGAKMRKNEPCVYPSDTF